MHARIKLFLFMIVCLCCLFLCSCGLDDYYVIEPPTATEVSPMQEDPDMMYYKFTCPGLSSAEAAQISMKRTVIYYKIYPESEYNQMITDRNTISASNQNEYSENGYFKMKALGNGDANPYLAMRIGNVSTESIMSTSSSQEWKMELQSNLQVVENNGNLKLLRGIYSGNSVDVYVQSPDSAGVYYINAYAVAIGDVSFQEHYSQLASLGVLKFTIQN